MCVYQLSRASGLKIICAVGHTLSRVPSVNIECGWYVDDFQLGDC